MFKIDKLISKPIFVALSFFVFCVIIIALLYFVSFNTDQQARYNHVFQMAFVQAHKIERELVARISTAQALSAFIEHEPAISHADFQRFAESLLQDDGGVIASMAYSPGLKIKMIWPENKVNDATINKLLTDRPGRAYYLHNCIDQKKAFVEGPAQFLHLDSALCLFTPVFTDSTASKDTISRSVADVTIRWNKFLQITGLSNLDSNIKIALRGVNGSGKSGGVFFGDASIFDKKNVVIIPIKLPMGEWIMAADSPILHKSTFVSSFLVLTLLFAIVVSVSVYFFLKYSVGRAIRQEHKYRYIIENSSDMMWVMDSKTLRYTFVSDNCTQYTGYTPEEYTKMTLHQVCTPESVAQYTDRLNKALSDLRSGKIKSIEATFEIQHYTKWNTKNWTETSVVAMADSHGDIVEIIGVSRVINDKKRLETAFKESERRYHLISENSNDAIWVLDIKTFVFNFISASTTKITGFTPEDMLGRATSTFMSVDSHEMLTKLFSSEAFLDISNSKQHCLDIQVYSKETAPIWVEVSARPMFDRKGFPNEVLVNVKNIEKQKKIEIALSESEKKFLTITANTRDHIWIKDANTMQFTYSSPASEYVCGYTSAEMQNFTLKDLYPPETINLITNIIANRIKQIKNDQTDKFQIIVELQQYHKDGSLVWVEVSVFGRLDKRKNPIEYLGITRNINDRKTLEISLKESETKYRVITENTKDIICVIDLKTWQYLYVNGAINDSIGFTADEFINLTLKDTTSMKFFNYISGVTNDLIKQYNAGEITEPKSIVELQLYSKAGVPVWAEVSFSLIKNNSEIFNQLIAVIRIIEDRKRLELAMQTKQNELSLANATKDKFFSIIAHDLKNPLSSLLQLSELLVVDSKDKHSETLSEDIQMLKDTLGSTYKLLENLLEWSRANMGAITYAPSKQNIIKIINNCLDYLKAQSVAKNITVEITSGNLSPQECLVCWVDCDYHMILTVLRNLLSNAIKFSFQGSAISVIVNEYSAAPTKYICVSVKDAGTGIAEEDIKKLFRIDEKIVSAKGTNDESGTGLGLILCKEFISKHNADIWVESTVGHGTIFSFTVPRWTNAN